METHLQNKRWRSECCTDVTAVYADSLMPRCHKAGLLATMLAALKGQAQLAKLNILPADHFSTFSTGQSGCFPLLPFDGNLIYIIFFSFFQTSPHFTLTWKQGHRPLRSQDQIPVMQQNSLNLLQPLSWNRAENSAMCCFLQAWAKKNKKTKHSPLFWALCWWLWIKTAIASLPFARFR